MLCELVAGGLSKNLSAKRAASELRNVRPSDAIGLERKRIAVEFLDELPLNATGKVMKHVLRES